MMLSGTGPDETPAAEQLAVCVATALKLLSNLQSSPEEAKYQCVLLCGF